MKYILSIIIALLVSMSFFSSNTYSSSDSLFNNTTTANPYDGKYGLKEGVEAINDIKAIETTRTASQYIQAVVKYILTFLFLLSVLIIIYAGFNLLTGLGDEEKAKKSKQIILYALGGIVIIFLAGPISEFIFNVLNKA